MPGVGVELVEGLGVVEWVVLAGVVEDSVGLGGSDCALDLVGVDDSGDVGVGDLAVGKVVSLLLHGRLGEGSEDIVELLEGALSPDDEPADVASGGELEKVESADVSDFNSGHVSECLDEGNIGSAVDNERSSSGSVPSVSELALSGSDLDGVDDLLDISPGSSFPKESDGLLGPLNLLDGITDDEGKFGDVINSVSSGLDEREDGGGGECGGNGVSLLLEVASSVPSSPDPDGGEHSTLSAHVTEGTLSVSAGSGSSNSGNTGDSATSSPGLGGVLHAGLEVDGVTLSSVLGNVGVDKVDDIRPDAGAEDSGEDDVASGALNGSFSLSPVWVVDVDYLSVDHGKKII